MSKTSVVKGLDHRFCVAPMLGATDRHFRYIARQLSQRAILYTELINVRAIVEGKYTGFIDRQKMCHPVALQLAGNDPALFAQAATLGEQWGFEEININIGCPSPRGVEGGFGACLMTQPRLMACCVKAIKEQISIPVTVKCRLGVGNDYPLERFEDFVGQLRDGGCQCFIIHARGGNIEWMNTKQNRSLLELRYPDVYHIKKLFPDLEIVINGNITTMEQCREHLQYVDGTMMGRMAYHNPYILTRVDSVIYEEPAAPIPSRRQLILDLLPYINAQLAQGLYLSHISRHLLGLFYGTRGARQWKQYLTEHTNDKNATSDELLKALDIAEQAGVITEENL